ncbi:MAG: hypothetical protein COV71_01740 [Candidatus Omnitrophica bacterium CG11_big_fil_rev_8_21_14_0_20_41_12]|nr:MAG: hypothetical protein COV71_01740 [Candidatus Omnitrophica bacterium CG11_big_fil_rev_8_21_14_0_20_41_12]
MNRRILISAMFFLALGGLLLHYRIHPFTGIYRIATIASLIDAFLITALLCARKSAIYGLLLKGMLTILGVVLMWDFSIDSFAGKHPSFSDWIFKSTLADILIALAGFLIAKAIYDLYHKVN